MEQLSMSGEDWKSDKQRATERRLIAARRKAGLACARALEGAADSLRAYLSACRACGDGSGDEKRGLADGRLLLIDDLMEYASWLQRTLAA